MKPDLSFTITAIEPRGAELHVGVLWTALTEAGECISLVVDTLVLTAMMFKGPLEGKHFVDIAENSGYWHFVVLSWIPIYAVIYWAPRF